MQRRPLTDISDFVDILRRRWFWMVVPAVFIIFATLYITSWIPKTYRSESLLLVEPQKIPEQYVQGTVTTDIGERLQNISQEILSRTRLLKIIEQFDLYKDKSGMTKEDLVEFMRMDIKLETIADKNNPRAPVNAFKIGYEGRDPQTVQNVTRQLASLFIEENLKIREQQAEGTSEFLQGELGKAKEEVDATDKKLADFKVKYMGSLPDQQQGSLTLIGQLQQMVQSNSDAIARIQQQKTYLQSVLAAVSVDPDKQPSKNPLKQQIEQMKVALAAAEKKYTEAHPDVQRMRQDLLALQEQYKQQVQELPEGFQPPDQVKRQIEAADVEIALRTKRQIEFEKRIRQMQGRMDMLPLVEQQFSALERDQKMARVRYDQILAKSNLATQAVEMERRAKGEQFRIVDPASYPEKPYKPDLLQLNLMGIALGLALGGALGLFLEFRDQSIHSEKDLLHYIGVAVMATVPVIETDESLRISRRKQWMKAGAAVAVFVPMVLFTGWYFREAIKLALKGVI